MVWTYLKGSLANTMLQNKVEGKRLRGRPVRQWSDDVNELMYRAELEGDVDRRKDRVARRKCIHRVAPKD